MLDVLGWGIFSPDNVNRNGSPESFDIFISVAQADELKLDSYKEVESFLHRKNTSKTEVIELWTDGINYYNEKEEIIRCTI